MGPIQSIDDLVSMIRRRLALVLTVFCLGILVALYLAVTSPRVFESSAVIQIEAPAIVDPASDSGVPVARRVQLIEQRMMVRSNLLSVIDRHQLYVNLPLSENQKVDLLRRSMRIDSVAAPGQGATTSASLAAIIITAQGGTAQQAAAIANDFADSVINRDEESRQSRIQETQQFLTGEEARIQGELDAHDRKVAEFTSKNEDALPSSQAYIQSQLTQLSEQDATLDRDIMSLERERLALQAGDNTQTVEGSGRSAASLVQQLRAAEVELSQAKRTLAPDHPEIARLQENVRRLTQGGLSDTSRVTLEQVELIDAQLRQLRAQKAAVNSRQQEIEIARSHSAEVVREYETLSREQQRQRDRYNEISRRLAEVETLQSLQENNQTERFVVLERALAPEYPALSGRKKSAVLGLFGSIFFSLGLAFIAEMRQPVLHSAAQFARSTGIQPFVELAYVPTDEDLDKAWRRKIYIGLILFWTFIGSVWLLGLLPGVPSPGVVGPMGSG
ncbi:GumC family protein [Paracoccus aminophilus]|uniref:Lipopolysaccharide biosynthesis protein n=1 Tax=Paracoccus aminophilus JCM 7686 TaxID=1367847 RepID=S5Y344_PARAH|nr:lipopolysaccharide biosynthesis protein [Paracoccus aminophilus]AGT10165.1 lipopolysaccharide biosynthesis protein [Paracoccus aminophilus JCM 7686]